MIITLKYNKQIFWGREELLGFQKIRRGWRNCIRQKGLRITELNRLKQLTSLLKPTLILNARLKPLAKNPPNGPITELKTDIESECSRNGYSFNVLFSPNCNKVTPLTLKINLININHLLLDSHITLNKYRSLITHIRLHYFLFSVPILIAFYISCSCNHIINCKYVEWQT